MKRPNSKYLRIQLLCTGFFTMGLLLPSVSYAQDESATSNLEEIVVTGQVTTRNRTTAVAPELTFDREFFEKFEPISVGDALKRVPGVAFTSDIGEFDAPQLRGLGEGFTQILINGRTIPGAGNDRSILVDRIPAELVERLEIIRSPSADIDSQGVGGTINIILKDGASLPPGFVARASGIYYEADEEFRGAGAVGFIGRSDDERFTYALTLNVQERYNPKSTIQEVLSGDNYSSLDAATEAYSDSSAGSVVADGEERAVQYDTRDNTDISFNADLAYKISDSTDLSIRGFIIDTDRVEREDSLVFEDSPTNLDVIEGQDTTFDQQNLGLSAVLGRALSKKTSFEVGIQYSEFDSVETEIDLEADPGDFATPPTEADLHRSRSVANFDLEEDDIEIIDSLDKEFQVDASVTRMLDGFGSGSGAEIKAGIQAKFRDRDTAMQEAGFDAGVMDPLEPSPGGGVFNITEDRYDAYLIGTWLFGDNVQLETGVRIEYTETEQVGDLFARTSDDDTEVNPSIHLMVGVGDNATFRASLAKTVRRPSFDQRIPFQDSDEPEDDDVTTGNPSLVTEISLGADVGFEFELPGRGIMGINAFYRDIDDLIQLVQINNDFDGDPATPGGLFSFDNVGPAQVYGIEFDLSTPLGFFGLPNTGFFANYTSLNSDRYDANFRRDVNINQQPDYIYNVGVSHSFEASGVSFGASYQKQGEYTSHFFGEIERGEVAGNLELFVEKQFGKSVVLRLSGNNLLDADTFQREENFDGDNGQEILDNSRAGIVDGFEIEREKASPVIQLTLRLDFES